MQKLLTACIAVLVLTGAGCSDVIKFGRILGFIVDGQTGQRLNMFSDGGIPNVADDWSSPNEVYAVVEGRLKRATPCGQGDGSAENQLSAEGCYRIEGVPVNQDVPLFAQYPGYQTFHGTTYVDSNKYSVDDVNYPDPQQIANIRLFPVGFSTDYRFIITNDSRPVEAAQVVCQLTDNDNSFETRGNFIGPESTTTPTVRATSDAAGVATVPGAGLVLGGYYHCEMFLTSSTNGRILSNDWDFVAGVDNADFYVSMSDPAPDDGDPLYVSYANNDDADFLMGASGNLVLVFNEPAEIVPGTADCQVATITTTNSDGDGSATPALPADAANVGVSETVTTTFSADGLVLTISTKALTTPYDTGDIGTSVNFGGIYVRPQAASAKTEARRVGAATPNASTSCALGTAWGTGGVLWNANADSSLSPTIRLF